MLSTYIALFMSEVLQRLYEFLPTKEDRQISNRRVFILGSLCKCVMRSFRQKAEAVTLQRSITLQPGEESEFPSTKHLPGTSLDQILFQADFALHQFYAPPKYRCFIIIHNLTTKEVTVLVGQSY